MADGSGETARIVLDITQTSITPFVSGVQRVVRDFAADNFENVAFIRFDPKSDRFLHVAGIPDIRRRTNTGPKAALRLGLQRVFLLLSRPWRQGTRAGAVYLYPLRRLARSVYVRWLADTYLIEDRRWRSGGTWTPNRGDALLVMDIPKDPCHLLALQTGVRGAVPLVMYVHDLIPIRHPEFFGTENRAGIRAEFLSYLDVVACADRIIANSETTATEFKRWFTLLRGDGQSRPAVRYPPVPGKWTRPSSSQAPLASEQRGTLRILAIGALDRRKNLAVVLRAAAILRALGHAANVTLVPPKARTEDPEAVTLIRALGEAVSIVDGVTDDELRELYVSHDVVVVPSRAEGFGLPVIEGLQHGRPVVASDIEVFRELSRLLPIALAHVDDPVDWARLILAAREQAVSGIPHGVFPSDWRDLAHDVLLGRVDDRPLAELDSA